MQADTLAAIATEFRDEVATKHDLALLRSELKSDMAVLRTEMKSEMSALRTEFKFEISGLRKEVKSELSEFRTEMATMKADLTWRFVALVVFLATVTSLVGFFVG